MITHKYPDVTLLLQGPMIDGRLDAMDHMGYYRILFGHIVISTYTEHINAALGFREWCANWGIQLVEQSINMPVTRNDGRIYYHTATTLKGLHAVTTPYVMKHRLDEKYWGLEQLVEKFNSDTLKMVCGTTVFGPKSYRLYHAADHLFIARTDLLLESWTKTWVDLQSGIMEGNHNENPVAPNQGAPEITFTKNYIRSLGHDPTPEQHDQLMCQFIDFVNNKYLWPFTIRENGHGSVYTTVQDLGPSRNKFETMQDMLEWNWDH